MFNDLGRLGKYLGQAARLMVGMPDYDNYVEHMQKTHPDKPVMTYEEFSANVRKRVTVASPGPSAVEPATRVNLWEPG